MKMAHTHDSPSVRTWLPIWVQTRALERPGTAKTVRPRVRSTPTLASGFGGASNSMFLQPLRNVA